MSGQTVVTVGNESLRTEHVDEAFARTLEVVLRDGHHLGTDVTEKSSKGSTEILSYQIVMANARDRIATNPKRPLNVVGAVARFTWMVAGSDRLEDIAFYEPKVRHYTDNNISVPGSNYGMRLFQPRPGLNQIRGVVDRILSEADSRRAAAVIWTPDDATRPSNDIPCAFGAFYHVRDGRLVTTTVMRSNNAFLLLPYNAFEFSVIGEMVAAAVRADLGPYVHYAASMHVIDSQAEAAREVIRDFTEGSFPRRVMPPMPRDPGPLPQAAAVAQLEAALRNDPARLTGTAVTALRSMPLEQLHPYWLAFYDVLLCHMLVHANRADDALEVAEQLPDYFAASVRFLISKAINERKTAGQLSLVPPRDDLMSDLAAATSDIDIDQFTRLDIVISDLENESTVGSVSRIEAVQLYERHLRRLAARNEGGDNRPTPYLDIQRNDVLEDLRLLRAGRK
jgi:thymidylate synthase